MSLSTWIMKLATRRPPAGREDWAQAMQAEFDSLKQGRLSWSLGCLATSAGWRLQGEAAYLAVILVGIVLFKDIVFQIVLWTPERFARPVYSVAYAFPYSYHMWVSLPFIVLCAGFGAFRPERVILTGIVATALAIVHTYLVRVFSYQLPFIIYMPFYYELPVLGEIICLCGALISAASGAWLGRRFMRAA